VKALLIVAVLLTLGLIIGLYRRNKDTRRLLVALATFSVIVSLGIVGNITRPIIPLFLAHIVLVVLAWGGLLYYLFRKKYLWWLIFSPAVTIILFVALSLLEGSRYEDVWLSL
jgi:heme A synthase